jgi:hypothetical protein
MLALVSAITAAIVTVQNSISASETGAIAR